MPFSPFRTALFASLAAALFASHAAHADHPPPPAWCAAHPHGEPPTEGKLEIATTSTDPAAALENIVGYGCNFSYDLAQHAAEVDAARQRWMKELGLTEETWPQAIAWVMSHHGFIGNWKPHDADARKTPMEQFLWIPINKNRSGQGFPALAADVLHERLTEEGRLAYVWTCLDSDNPVDWAMCADDLQQPIDAAKLNAELAADLVSYDYQKFNVRIAAWSVRQWLAKHAEQVSAISAKDPAYAKLFEIAAKARTDWAQLAAANPDLFKLVDDLEAAADSHSRSAGANCMDRVWPLWKSTVGSLGAKAFPGKRSDDSADKLVTTILDDPRGDMLASAMNLCAPGFLAKGDHDRLRRHGPRTAALVAMMDAGLKLDDATASIEFPRPNDSHGTVAEPVEMPEGKGKGIVAKVSADGDRVTIGFKHDKYSYTACAHLQDTNRIDRILPDGHVYYRQVCTATGTFYGVTGDPDVTIPKRYGGSDVKPGMYVDIDHGVVIIGYASSTAKLPNMIFGVLVK